MKKQREIRTNRPAITDAEINQYKQDFNNILNKFSNMSNGLGLGSVGNWAMGIVAAAAIGAGSWFVADKLNNNDQINTSIVETEQINDTLNKNEITEKEGINPPLPDKLEFEEYYIDNSKEISITTESGSKIHIPKNAFVDIDGNPVKGDIKIEFKDYHNPLDFFISGIPMEYDSSGTNYTFESGGMFQIFAKQNNKDVYLADNKYIDIDLLSKSDEKFNFYEYDTIENNWKYEKTETTDDYEILADKKDEIEKEVKKYEDYASNPDTETDSYLDYSEKITYDIPKRRRNPERYAVSVKNDKGEEELYEIEPEQGFKEKYYRVRWDNIRVKDIPDEEGYYNLELVKDEIKKDFKAYPVSTAEESEIEEAIEIQEEEKADRLAKLNKERKIIAKKRKEISRIERLVNTGYISNRNIRVYNMGTYNCDRPIPRPYMARRGKGTLVDSLGSSLRYNKVYVAQAKNNSIFNYPHNSRWYYSGGTENILWALTDDYKVAILTPEKFEEVGSTKLQLDLYNTEEGMKILEYYFN